ncbi:MAG: glycosyltransferase family 39 protein [Erythrobacter sp.]
MVEAMSREMADGKVRQVPGWNRSDLVSLLVLAVVILVVRGAYFGDPNADIDEQLYSLIGLEMTRGALPFVDLWDRKPIGLFAIFALAHAVGGPGPLAYQLLAALFTLAGAYMTYRLALRLVDRVTGLGAGVLYVFLISIYGSHSANSEAFFVPMMLGMALLVCDPDHPRALRRAFLAMLIGGMALQVKYTVLPQCVFFGLWVLWHRYRRGSGVPDLFKTAATFAFLGLLPTLLVAIGYAVAGYWDDFLFANFISFFDRLPSSTGRFSRENLLFQLPVIGLLVAAIYAAIRLTPPRDWQTYCFFLLWLGATIGTIHLPATVYLYYFASFAAAVPLCALPILDRRGVGGSIPMLLVLAGFAYLLFLPERYAQANRHIERMERLAKVIEPRVNRTSDCLYIFDGPTSLYRMSGSCLPTRFIYPDHLNNAFERNSLGVPQIVEVARILARDPPVIVTAETALTPQNKETKALVDATVRRDYEEIAHEKLHERTIRVWARRESPPDQLLVPPAD